jgi:hypothetical protein
MTSITIDETGKLETPIEIRQQLGLITAQSFNLEIGNGCIILQPVDQTPKLHREGTTLVLETPPLVNLETLIEDLYIDRIQCQQSP